MSIMFLQELCNIVPTNIKYKLYVAIANSVKIGTSPNSRSWLARLAGLSDKNLVELFSLMKQKLEAQLFTEDDTTALGVSALTLNMV